MFTAALLGLANLLQFDRSDRLGAGILYKLAYESDRTNISALFPHLKFLMQNGVVKVLINYLAFSLLLSSHVSASEHRWNRPHDPFCPRSRER